MTLIEMLPWMIAAVITGVSLGYFERSGFSKTSGGIGGLAIGIASWFLFVYGGKLLLFWLDRARTQRTTSSPMKSLRTGKVLAGSNAFGFELVDREDNIRHERVVEVGGRRVLLLLPEDEHAFAAALPFAQKLIDDLETFSAAFDKFKQTVTAKVGSEDIGELSIATIEFYGIQPEVAEVVFQPTSSGRFWVALYKNGELSNMHEET